MKFHRNQGLFISAAIALTAVLAADLGFLPPLQRGQNLSPALVKQARAQSQPQIYVWSDAGGYSRNGVIALAATDEPAVRTNSYNISGNAEVTIYQADEDALLNYLVHDKDYNQKNPNTDASKLRLVTTLRHDIPSQGEGTKLLLPLGESGIWFVRIKLAGATKDVFIIRSITGVVVKEGNDEFIFWAQSFKTRRSVTDGAIKIYNMLDGRNELGSGTFDAQGLTRFPLTLNSEIAMVSLGEDRALVPINLHHLNYNYNYREFQPKSRRAKYFIFTDRPIYRPGDKVFFKSVLRDDDDARYTIPGGSAKVTIYHDWDERNAIYDRLLPITSQGTVYGEVTLPADTPTGDYQLKVSIPNAGTGNYWDSWSNTSSFQVEYFRKPEYSIDITAPRTELIAGDTSSFEISGGYFFGQPLAKQKIKYKIYTADFYEYDYLSSLDYALDNAYRYGYWSSTVFSEGEVELDQKGRATVEFKPQIPQDRGRSQVFSIEAEFDDGTGNPSFARKNILAFAGEYGIYRDETGLYGSAVGERYNLPLKIVSHYNSSVGGIDLKASVVRENWVSYQEPNQKYPSYRKEEETLPELSARTDSQGRATFSFTPTKTGSYRFTVRGRDSRGNQLNKKFYTWVYQRGEAVYFGQGDASLQIQAEKQQYAPGDTARLTISSSVPDRDVLLSFERGRVNRFQIVHLSGKAQEVDVPLVDTDMPNIFAAVGSFSDSFYNESSIDVPVSALSKKLKVNFTPDRKNYGPGQTVTVNIQTTDVGGRPVGAELAVWAVDKALFELVDSKPADIFDSFWRERGNDTQESHSLRGISEEGAEGGGCFAADTPILMADGTRKNIQDVVAGDTVLTRKSEQDSRLAPAKVMGTHQARVSGYFIVNGDLRVTPNHRLFVNGAWNEAQYLQIGDRLVGADGREVKVFSLEWQAGKYEVYNLQIEKYHTYFAGGVWVHNQKGDGGRTIFKDTAYWNPVVRTDSAGQAQIRFKLPDNLTTWVISAIGATIDTKLGQNTDEIVVTKDVVVRPIVPNILRSGDDIVLSAMVQNFTELDQDFSVSLGFDSGMIETPTTTMVNIKSKDLQQLYWKVHPQKESAQAKLIFSARSVQNSKLADSMTVAIPVWAFGFWEKTAATGDGPKNYDLKLAADSSREKSTVSLSLSPTLLGTMPAAMAYLIAYPFGCVEQTTSRFVPVVIAKQNQDLFAAALADKNVDDMIRTGVNRLASLQHGDGGWAWWSSGDSNAFITAYVVEYLVKAKQAGYEVSSYILDNAQKFLESVQGERDRTIPKIYGLSFLNSSQSKTLITQFDNLNPDLLALAVMANVKNGEKNPDKNGLNKLIALGKEQGDGLFWTAGTTEHFGSQDASTAFAIRAIVAAGGDRDIAVKATRYLTRNRKNDYWTNTFATAQIMQALVDLSKTGQELNPNYSYIVNLDGRQIAAGRMSSAKQVIKDLGIPVSQIKTAGSRLELVKQSGDGQLYSTLVIKEFRTDKNLPAENHGLNVSRVYRSERGSNYSLAVGDTVIVELTISGLAADEHYGIIDDALPSGLIPINESLQNEQYGQGSRNFYSDWGGGDREVTQNGTQISLYQVSSGSRSYIIYKARAVSAGTFSVPPATASLMYAPEVYGRSRSQTVTIDDQPHVIPGRQLQASAAKIFSNKLILILLVIALLILVIVAIVLYRRRRTPPPDNLDGN